MLRRLKVEVRQLATQEFIPAETDAEALEDLQALLSYQPGRKEIQQMKEIFALLVWNINRGMDITRLEKVKSHKELDIPAFLKEDEIAILARIQDHIFNLPTRWDRKRSKWTYVTLIRDLEPESPKTLGSRKFSNRELREVPSNVPSINRVPTIRRVSSINLAIDSHKPMPHDIQRSYDDLTSKLNACVDSGALGAAQVAKLKTSLHGMYLIAARNELAINALRDCLAVQQETLNSIRSTVNSLSEDNKSERSSW